MRKYFNKLSLFSLILILGLILIGCGTTTNDLVVGTNAYFPPYEYYEGNNIVGVDIEIATEIANRLGKNLVIEDMEFENLIPATKRGKLDVTFAAMTITEDRLKEISFTDSYAEGIQQIIVLKDSNIYTMEDLNDKIIGVQAGTTGAVYAKDTYDTNIEEYVKSNELLQALESGIIDAIIIDNGPAKSFVTNNSNLKLLDVPFVEEYYAACVAQDNLELLNSINKIIEEMKADGTLDAILQKYNL